MYQRTDLIRLKDSLKQLQLGLLEEEAIFKDKKSSRITLKSFY